MAEAVALPVRLQTLQPLCSQAAARGLGDCRSGSRLADPCGTLVAPLVAPVALPPPLCS